MTGQNLLRCDKGATAAEFALVLPLLLILMFGVIDGGRFLWQLNVDEKATQEGARFAAVTNMVPSGLGSYKFPVGSSVTPGTPVPTTVFDSVTCGTKELSGAAGCAIGTVGPPPGYDATALDNIGRRMRAIDPTISNDDFTVTYRNVGLGYAGNPYGPDVSPEVTVSLRNKTFVPITSFLFLTISMPSASSSITGEDELGTEAT